MHIGVSLISFGQKRRAHSRILKCRAGQHGASDQLIRRHEGSHANLACYTLFKRFSGDAALLWFLFLLCFLGCLCLLLCLDQDIHAGTHFQNGLTLRYQSLPKHRILCHIRGHGGRHPRLPVKHRYKGYLFLYSFLQGRLPLLRLAGKFNESVFARLYVILHCRRGLI